MTPAGDRPPIRHHYRRQRGATGCRLCGRIMKHPIHWEYDDD